MCLAVILGQRSKVSKEICGSHSPPPSGRRFRSFTPPPPLPNLERVVEVGEIFSPSRDPHIPEMPYSSPPPSEHVPDEMPQPSPAHTEQVHDEMPQSSQQAQPIHEQRVPPEEATAQEDEDVPEWELQKKHQSP